MGCRAVHTTGQPRKGSIYPALMLHGENEQEMKCGQSREGQETKWGLLATHEGVSLLMWDKRMSQPLDD